MIIPPLTGESKSCGIYKIVFDGDWFYIGRSTDLHTRFKSWKSHFGKTHINRYFAKLSPEVLKTAKVEIIEYCTPSELKEKEDFYIKSNINSPYLLNSAGKPIPPEFKSTTKYPSITAPEFKPLAILRTEGEWEIIMKKISQCGKRDLSVFIRSEVRKLNGFYKENPKKYMRSPGKKIYKRPYIPVLYYKKLKEMAKQMQMPVSTVVDIFIIQPLLTPKP